MSWRRFVILAVLTLSVSACTTLKEVRGKTKFGPEFRHSGGPGRGTDLTRWTAQQGIDFKWENGWTTGIEYRRRDLDDGATDRDNGVWISVSYPLWKAEPNPKKNVDRRIEELEHRIAELEQQKVLTRVHAKGSSGGDS
jgi:hypothetical protein